MNAFMQYFSWLNQVFDRNKDRGFVISTCVWFLYMGFGLTGLCLMIIWAAILIVWEILSCLFSSIKRISK